MRTHPLEAAREMELALHHVEEDGDGGLSQLDLGNKRHLQDRTHHLWNEFNLVGPLREGGGEKTVSRTQLICRLQFGQNEYNMLIPKGHD